jgi:hypothetical protein
MIVGKLWATREVSELNHEIFTAARERIDAAAPDAEYWHMGWKDIGDLIDFIEANYVLERKEP